MNIDRLNFLSDFEKVGIAEFKIWEMNLNTQHFFLF